MDMMLINPYISRKWERRDHILALHPNRNIKHAFVSRDHSVQISFVFSNKYGRIAHLWVKRHNGRPTTWKEMQQIKDELIGGDKVGIEVFPKIENIIDQAPMYHIWVFEDFDFGISDGIFNF
jgi:hypothetical protein